MVCTQSLSLSHHNYCPLKYAQSIAKRITIWRSAELRHAITSHRFYAKTHTIHFSKAQFCSRFFSGTPEVMSALEILAPSIRLDLPRAATHEKSRIFRSLEMMCF